MRSSQEFSPASSKNIGATTAPSRRDNFSAAHKQALAKRVNYHCSICDAQTIGPRAESTGTVLIGIAAHIRAASPGGPRYDPDQTADRRGSIENGIWLCSKCAIAVDSDVSSYPPERLLALKVAAERLASNRLGISASHAPLMRVTPTEISRAVKDFCLFESARAEAIDPRWSVSVSHAHGVTEYNLRANEAVPGAITVSHKYTKQFTAGLRELYEFGGEVQFEDLTVKIEGSPLFPERPVSLRRLKIAGSQRQANLTLSLAKDNASGVLSVEFNGSFNVGVKGGRFVGAALGGVASLQFRCDVDSGDGRVTLNLDPSPWKEKPISKLPHFDRVRKIIGALASGSQVEMTLEIEGHEIFSGSGMFPLADDIRAHEAFVQRLEQLRRIDKFFSLELVMPASPDEFLPSSTDLIPLLQIICIEEADNPTLGMTFTAEHGMEFDYLAKKIEEQVGIELTLRQSLSVSFLGVQREYQVDISCAKTIVNVVGPANLKPGVPIELSCKPEEGHRWSAKVVGRTSSDVGDSQQFLCVG